MQHLGQVKRLYIEACAIFSLYRNEDPKPGLSVLPQQDRDLLEYQPQNSSHHACSNCGNTEETHHKPNHACPRCGVSNWSPALETIPANHNEYTLREAGE